MIKRKKGKAGSGPAATSNDRDHSSPSETEEDEEQQRPSKPSKKSQKTISQKQRRQYLKWFGYFMLLLFVVIFIFQPKIIVRLFKRGRRLLFGRSKGQTQNSVSTDNTAEDGADFESLPSLSSEELQVADIAAWDVEKFQTELDRMREIQQKQLALLSTNVSQSVVISKKLVPTITRPVMRQSQKTRRMFGCMRDTCRGLEIEDLFDRGYFRSFRSALKNDTTTDGGYDLKLNYRVTILLLDTTQLNHMKLTVPSLFKKVWETQASSSYVIAFEGGDAMGGNKGFQLRQKDRFARAFMCDYNTLKVQPKQYRLYVKPECDALLELSKNDRATSFLLKPEQGSQGQGITFHASAEEIVEKRPEFFPCKNRHGIAASSRYLVQEYIVSPLLLAKSKFDSRVYMFISSADPYLLWYHRGYLRRSLTPYSPTSRDRKAYLTNTHFQSSRANFNMSEHIWTFPRMQSQLVKQNSVSFGFVESVLEPWIKEYARFIFESAREKIIPRKGTNQIIGLDFMVDSKLGLHFIEANGYPGFTWSVNFDSRGMVEDMFDLMQEQGESPSAFKYLRNGDWFGGFQLFHSDARPHRIPYNPCIELGDNGLLMKVIESAVKLTTASSSSSRVKTEDDEDDESGSEDVSKELVTLMESLPAIARNSCSLLIAPSYNLVALTEESEDSKEQDKNDKDEDDEGDETTTTKKEPHDRHGDCQDLFKVAKSVDLTTNVMVTASATKAFTPSTPLLFPNVTSLITHLKDCASISSLMTVTLVPVNEMRLSVESVAYPGGRKPFLPFHREGSAGLEMQEKGLNLDGSPISAAFNPKPDDPVFVRAQNVLKTFAVPANDISVSEKRKIVYRVRRYMYVHFEPVKHRMLFAWSFPGYAYSLRRAVCSNGAEQYETYVQGEHCLDMDMFDDVLTWHRFASTHYISSVFEPSVRRVMEHALFTLRVKEKLRKSTSKKVYDRIFAFDFSIDTQLRPRLVRVQHIREKDLVAFDAFTERSRRSMNDEDNDESAQEEDDAEPVPAIMEHADVEGVSLRALKRLRQGHLRLRRIVSSSPFYFARARRGDAFEAFRMVYNEIQEIRRPDEFGLEHDPCQDTFPAYKDLKFAIDLENVHLKQKNVVHRDLNKRLWKKWSVCRVKMKEENKRKCMMGLLTERYRLLVRKFHLLSDENRWVSETLQSLMDFSKSKRPGSEDDEEGGGGKRKRDDGMLDV